MSPTPTFTQVEGDILWMMQNSFSLTTKDNLPVEGDWYHFYTAAYASEPLPYLHRIPR